MKEVLSLALCPAAKLDGMMRTMMITGETGGA
jgi:hypothetical protein